MFSRWLGLLTLGLLSLGPGLFWSPSAKHVGHSAGWSAVPLPGQILEAKSKLVSSGEAFTAVTFSDFSRTRVVPVWDNTQTYQTPHLAQRLYLFYSRLQTDGG
ncbi:MAG: hypothetical protein C4331_13470 [Meiothermus sp.]